MIILRPLIFFLNDVHFYYIFIYSQNRGSGAIMNVYCMLFLFQLFNKFRKASFAIFVSRIFFIT